MSSDEQKPFEGLRKHPNGASVCNIAEEIEFGWKATKKSLLKLEKEKRVKLIRGVGYQQDKWMVIT